MPTRWLTRSSYRHSDLAGDWAGLQALVLLAPAEQAHIAAFLAPFLPQWVPVIVGYPYITNGNPIDAIRRLVCAAYSRVPDAVTAALCDRIRQQAEQQIHVTVLPLIEGCWDDRIAAAVFALARDPAFPPEMMVQLIEALLARQAPDTIPFLESLVGSPLPEDEWERRRSVVAAHLLVRYAPASWPHVWAAMQSNDAYGRELIDAMIGADHWTATSVRDLSADALADLYIWLVARFPHREDPADAGDIVRNATTRDVREWWRDSIVTLLRDRATPDAVAALRRIGAAMPHSSWIRIAVAQAEEAMREATWQPLYTPEQLLRLARDRNLRAAQNGNQLLVVVAESLVRLDREVLHGQTPQVRLLWNDLGNGSWRPKDEATLSDYAKVHLERELNDIIVNREVQIHHGSDRLDILVDAISHDGLGGRGHRVSVVIEVKGGWNEERWTAMRTQLGERYLTDSAIHHGIYLVGWYMCDEWDPSDSRFDEHPRQGGIAALRTRLEAQATESSSDARRMLAVVLDVSLGEYRSPRHRRSAAEVSEP